MTAANWLPSFKLTDAYEGGFVNHPRDPGGATNRGVTQKVYDAYRTLKGLDKRSVRHIDTVEVIEIYLEQYWSLIQGDKLPAGLDFAVYDFAVNSGVSRAAKFLQRICGLNDVDGVIGMATLARVKVLTEYNEEGLIIRLCEERMNFLRQLPTFATFGKGWTRRVMGAKTGAQEYDTGVIDLAIAMARKDDAFTTPAAIGLLKNEVNGKGHAIGAHDVLPLAPMAYTDLVASRWK